MPDSGPARNPDRVDQALNHLKMGFAGFSVWSTLSDGTCKCVKGRDCTSPGKHPIPPKGFLAATTDPATLTTMMSAASEPNYGIVWPEDSRIVVIIDVDGKDWAHRLDILKSLYGPLPPTKTTRTPSGGLHLFYEWPEGVPVPEGNTLHGFVTRFPWKGYVVGPGSRINGKMYAAAGPDEIAVLPVEWVEAAGGKSGQQPLITVTDEQPGYEMPDSVETGHRHDEIVKLAASLWNKRVDRTMGWPVLIELSKRFVEPMDDPRLKHEWYEAYDTAEKKWETPGGGPQEEAQTDEGIVIDPLAIETRIEQVQSLDFHAFPIPMGLTVLLQHLDSLTDAPHSSLALTSMVTMSALVGPAPTLHWRGKHRCALFGCLVGHSGVGRKGATMREVEAAFMQVDPALGEMQVSGIASGEVLVDILNEQKVNPVAHGTALIWEHEIANVLILAAREGSIMSGNLRRAWDGDTVQSRSRAKGKTSAFGYNVAFMGGVTPGELAKRLSPDDIGNGWANRFLWFHSEKRDHPYDGTLDQTMNATTLDYLQQCVEFGRALGGSSMLIKPAYTMTLAAAAEDRLNTLALALDVPPVGAIGALRQRMPAHVIRLAMVAAIMDMESVVGLDHVTFGEIMVGYAVDSMRAVFGIRVDDPVAMNVLDLLRQSPDGWLNTSTIARALSKSGDRVNKALHVLLDAGLIVREDRKTGGRTSIGYRLGAF